ncbi:uncharacterized protein PHACADRAFT_264377 [Phanerochaete carnosa HHB-10118-sp]|uniref:choline-phosphate cytidylyltransferase n=1 Tax=Phanerochaete carnosa (strain HHB-10118-sp) TaxID=650164 RepID=K5UK21_PHACS|nr:uncharacterized protein PHACADRAFT_264377 [Phanerochaete carnosa HHB-10118-sp]EKM49931.1 hypothetical protein PHACADRAFT_264377 [Phanerochaete carnosa HHB-10118-sp]
MRRSIDAMSAFSNDDFAEYDFVSEGQRSLESSIASLGLGGDNVAEIHEPAPSQAARATFITPSLTPEDIRAYVQRSLGPDGRIYKTVRVYVDGLFDPFTAGHALQLRQAKLSFPNVHLLVGVFPGGRLEQYGRKARIPHVERCELVRHCRWVDEIVEDAPWQIDEAFLNAHRIDYVAIDEGASIDPAYGKERVKGFDLVKNLRKAVPTRPTPGLTALQLCENRGSETPALEHGTIKGLPSSIKMPTGQDEEKFEDPFEVDEPPLSFLE